MKIKVMFAEIVAKIISDIKADNNMARNLILAAYNDNNEDEHFGVDYVFNIDNQDDLLCCVKGGMRAHEVAWLYNRTQNGRTPYFFFGENHVVPQPIDTFEDFDKFLFASVDEVVAAVLECPYAHESFKEVYDKYIKDFLTNV